MAIDNETKLELIKAFAFDMDIEEIANLGDMTIEQAEQFKIDNADEITERRNMEGQYGD